MQSTSKVGHTWNRLRQKPSERPVVARTCGWGGGGAGAGGWSQLSDFSRAYVCMCLCACACVRTGSAQSGHSRSTIAHSVPDTRTPSHVEREREQASVTHACRVSLPTCCYHNERYGIHPACTHPMLMLHMHHDDHADCTELYLGHKGIERLRGFEPFVSLESLWLNGNRLKKINNLDGNFRIRSLYAQVRRALRLRCRPPPNAQWDGSVLRGGVNGRVVGVGRVEGPCSIRRCSPATAC